MHAIAQQYTADAPTGQPTAEVAPRQRVLFVNSDSDLRKVVCRVLGRERYDVRAVAHSGHALLLTRTGSFDVLIAELCGPDMSGPALFEQLRRHCPGIDAIYLANPGSTTKSGDVLVRPFTSDDLLQRLELGHSRA